MPDSSDDLARRRQRNAGALSAFGGSALAEEAATRVVLEGEGPTVWTIGYERRDGEQLVDALASAGVQTLVDVRQRAMSRKPDFRGKRLAALCEAGGIGYVAAPRLGSDDDLRDALRETGDFDAFTIGFRALMEEEVREEALEALRKRCEAEPIALLCYERCHGECHRSVIAGALHDRIDARIVAIL